jgi:quercetin dioxygenase-like cupin family protein
MVQQIIDQPLSTASDTVGGANENHCQLVRAGTGPIYRSPVDEIRFLFTSAQTGGAYFMAEVSVPPGRGNPPHIHRHEEETFYMQQGMLTVRVGEQTLTVRAGDMLCLRRGIPHSFQNSGDVDAKFLLLAVPGGLEKFFEEAFYPVTECPEPPPVMETFLGKVLAAASKCGLEFLPPA